MESRLRSKSAAVLVIMASTLVCPALQLRSYNPARHDRFTGFSTSPVVNHASWFDDSALTGVGWVVTEPKRQLALISPSYVITASHYPLLAGTQIRFISASGIPVTATVASSSIIVKSGQSTDLTVGRLTAPISSVGVTPVAYLNLPTQSQYVNTDQGIFGFNTSGGDHPVIGYGRIYDFDNFSFFGTTTRMSYFFHIDASGSQDDCYFISGDSGSPSLAMTRNGPALVGTHSLVGDEPGFHYSLDSHVPHYLAEINAILAADSESMTPIFTDPTPLHITGSSTPDPLRRAAAGSATFTIENQGATDALHTSVTLIFPSTAAPTTVTATGWINDMAGPLVWTYHRENLAPSASNNFVATWSSVPVISSLPVTISHISDGSPQQTSEYDLAPKVSYALWSSGLAQPATDDDPDGDGKTNLIEYAFGSSPASGVNLLPGNVVAGTALTSGSGGATLRFPVRSDSQVRGLSYVLEFSNDLISWTMTQPLGTTATFASYTPVINGFMKRTITFPANEARKFVRVRIVLDENSPGMAVP
jgi:hypothetical protein